MFVDVTISVLFQINKFKKSKAYVCRLLLIGVVQNVVVSVEELLLILVFQP